MSVFCRTDTATDSERFYTSVLEFLEHPEEREDVNELIDWWNLYVQVRPLDNHMMLIWCPQSNISELHETRPGYLEAKRSRQTSGEEGGQESEE